MSARPPVTASSRRPGRLLVGLVAGVLSGLAGGLAPARAGDAAADFATFSTFFRKELDSDKPEARMRAVRRAQETVDPRTIELLFEAEAKEVLRRTATDKARTEAEASLETALGEIEKLQKQSPRTPKEIEAFNKKVKGVEAKRDDLSARLRDLAVDAVQGDAVLGAMVGAMGALLDKLPPATVSGALALAAERWANPKASIDRQVRQVDLLAAITTHPTAALLRAIVKDAARDARVRTVALGARLARGDEGLLDDCVGLLCDPPGPLLTQAVDGLRRIHKTECIEPLIAFLGRADLGRLREDARRSLASLTGEKHGPYQQPWADWWKDAKATFKLPSRPADVADLSKPDQGVTFYGITSFSDKVLFILDVSGSMKDKAHEDATGVRGEEAKIDVARREVVSALAMLDEKKTFNAIFFNHRVVRWQGAMTAADRASVDRAKRFAQELEPSGGTNIHDALEAAFQLAGVLSSTGVDGKLYLPIIDTIYFMTDGTPTAGKLVKPDDILGAVRGWNRLAKIQIHCVGVGDACDVKFLAQLAKENGGTFVHR